MQVFYFLPLLALVGTSSNAYQASEEKHRLKVTPVTGPTLTEDADSPPHAVKEQLRIIQPAAASLRKPASAVENQDSNGTVPQLVKESSNTPVLQLAAGDMDCVGEWSPCTVKCEYPEDRIFQVTLPARGGGKPCPAPGSADDCRSGDGGCVEKKAKNPNTPPPCCNQTNSSTLTSPNCTLKDMSGYDFSLAETDDVHKCKKWDGPNCQIWHQGLTCEKNTYMCDCDVYIDGMQEEDEENRYACRKKILGQTADEKDFYQCKLLDSNEECFFGKKDSVFERCSRWSQAEEDAKRSKEDRTAPWEDCGWMKKEAPDKAVFMDACAALTFKLDMNCMDWAVDWKSKKANENFPGNFREIETTCLVARTELTHRQLKGLAFPASSEQVCMWCLENLAESINPY